MFEYSSNARARGVKDIGVGLALTGVSGAIVFMFHAGGDMAVAFWIFACACFVFFLTGLVFMIGGLARIVTGGVWQIRVDRNGVSWQAPLIAERSFRYALDEVRGIEERIRRKTREDGRVKEKREFVLLGVDGVEHRLTHQSGVDLQAFVEACTAFGVALSERVFPYRRRKDL